MSGDDIPLSAQIVSVVDTFDAITSTRPYRPARSLDEARSELTADVGDGRFAAPLVDEFLKLVDSGVVQAGHSE